MQVWRLLQQQREAGHAGSAHAAAEPHLLLDGPPRGGTCGVRAPWLTQQQQQQQQQQWYLGQAGSPPFVSWGVVCLCALLWVCAADLRGGEELHREDRTWPPVLCTVCNNLRATRVQSREHGGSGVGNGGLTGQRAQ